MTTLEIAKKLISIPSYIGEEANEKKLADFVFDYLKQFSFLKVKKQRIDSKRYNIVAETGGIPNVLFAGHLDTVEPRVGWKSNQFKGVVKEGKLFGLGAYDMKGGLAAILASLQDVKDLRNVALLFYCGEEYTLDGMKKFIGSIGNKKFKPTVIIAEPTDLKIWDTHRGLIEIKVCVQGITAHAATGEGLNAIDGLNKSLTDLKLAVDTFSDERLGKPSVNVAFIRGGLYKNKFKDEIELGNQGNNVADYAEAIVDIRTVSTKLDAKIVSDNLKKTLTRLGYKCDVSIKHDFGPLISNRDQISVIKNIVKNQFGAVNYLDPKKRGYGDGQLMQKAFGVPVIYFGPKGSGMHEADEWVDIKSLDKLRMVFSAVMKKYME